MVSEVTALFTTGKAIAGERATSALDRQGAGLPVSPREDRTRVAPVLAGPAPRYASETGGIRTRFPRSEVSEVFTTSERMPAARGGDCKGRTTRRKTRG